MCDFKGHPWAELKTITFSMNLQIIKSRSFLKQHKIDPETAKDSRYFNKEKYAVQGGFVAEQLKKLILTESASFEDTNGQ